MQAMRRLLLIDDDEGLGPPLTAFFRRFEIELVHATRPRAGLALLHEQVFDAAILDVMLPEMDGFELCRTIRRDSTIPIVMLTARGDVMDRVVGLELGADDYLPKPFEPRELLARLQTIWRRTANELPDRRRLLFDGLEIDLDQRRVRRHHEVVALTGTAFELLALLAGAPNKVFSRDDILDKLRGRAAEDIHSRAVDILVSRLRRKLEPLDVIRTLRNAGYLFAGARE